MKNSERFVWTLLALGAFAAGSRGHFNESSSGAQSASPGGAPSYQGTMNRKSPIA